MAARVASMDLIGVVIRSSSAGAPLKDMSAGRSAAERVHDTEHAVGGDTAIARYGGEFTMDTGAKPASSAAAWEAWTEWEPEVPSDEPWDWPSFQYEPDAAEQPASWDEAEEAHDGAAYLGVP
jgi:hypothetical protein